MKQYTGIKSIFKKLDPNCWSCPTFGVQSGIGRWSSRICVKEANAKLFHFREAMLPGLGAGFYTMKHEERERPGEGRDGSPAAVGPLGSKI